MTRKSNAAIMTEYRDAHNLAPDVQLYTLHEWPRHGRRVIPHEPANHHVKIWKRSGRCFYLAEVALYSIDKTESIK